MELVRLLFLPSFSGSIHLVIITSITTTTTSTITKVIGLQPCWSTPLRDLVEHTNPKIYFSLYPVLTLSVIFAEPPSYKDVNKPTPIVNSEYENCCYRCCVVFLIL
ncbi:uncharacterized protein LOC128247065 [Octopus bimaculoides]|uniref:uncharacterized protein LOC128247065 n=1 Tax=Octopus bimaculoides TaxID=37653 RepID=UPI0022E4613C|nr:uncharacterized protein LOC128247065 [Octopus bimaculoides]